MLVTNFQHVHCPCISLNSVGCHLLYVHFILFIHLMLWLSMNRINVGVLLYYNGITACHGPFPYWLIFWLYSLLLFVYDITVTPVIFIFSHVTSLLTWSFIVYIYIFFSHFQFCAYNSFNCNSFYAKGNDFFPCSSVITIDDIEHQWFILFHWWVLSRFVL